MSRSSRMAGRIAFASVVAAVGLPLTASASPALAPAAGSYAFVVERGGAKSGDSTVTVKSVSGGVGVHESETFPGETDIVDETLDAADLSPTSYVSSFPLTSDIGVTAHLAFYSGGARETVDGTTGATDFKLENGTKHMVVLDRALMTGFLFLPAQIKAMGLTAFTTLSPSRADTYDCHLDLDSGPTRPSAVPAADASITVEGTAPAGNVEFTEWFDPTTMVVDEVDVPAQQVTIARVRK